MQRLHNLSLKHEGCRKNCLLFAKYYLVTLKGGEIIPWIHGLTNLTVKILATLRA